VTWRGRRAESQPQAYIIGVEPLASASPDDVVRAIAPTFQRYLTQPLCAAARIPNWYRSRDDPVDHDAEWRPPSRVGDEVGAVLPEVLEPVPAQPSDQEPR